MRDGETIPDGKTFDLRRIGSAPDYWYPIAWSREVKPGKAFAGHFAGEPIVVVRQKDGRVFALEDRCAHRQVPLSKGVVQGDAIRCCYHGWTYNSAGKCVDVPYLGKYKLPNGVRSYACRETSGIVFVWPGEGAPDKPLPVIGAAADPAFKTHHIGKTVACHYTFMHENLMDMHHQFLHRGTTGIVKARYLGRRRGENSMEVDYSFSRPGGKSPLGESLITSKGRKPASDDDDKMTIRTTYPYQDLRFWTNEEQPVLHVWLGYTPVDRDQTSNRSFIVLSVQKPRIPLVLDIVWPALVWFTNRVFDEDRSIVEMEQRAFEAQGGDRNQEVFPPIQELRGLLAECGVPLPSMQEAAE